MEQQFEVWSEARSISFCTYFFWSTNIYPPENLHGTWKNACFWKGIPFFQVATFRFYVSFSDRMRNGAIGCCGTFFQALVGVFSKGSNKNPMLWGSIFEARDQPLKPPEIKAHTKSCASSVGWPQLGCGGEVGIFPRGKEDNFFWDIFSWLIYTEKKLES